MANLIRSGRSGSDWTEHDLNSYNIQVRLENAHNFFGANPLPLSPVDPELLTTRDAEDMVSDANAELINLLDLAMEPGSEESAVDDFAMLLFRFLGYPSRHRVARAHKDIPLLICGENRHAKTGVCLIDRSQGKILLVVQEDKRFGENPLDAESQPIAEAIGAFAYNNTIRERANLPTLESQVCSPIISRAPLLTRQVDHAGHHSRRDHACLLQDPRYYRPRATHQPRLLPAPSNHRHRTRPAFPLQ